MPSCDLNRKEKARLLRTTIIEGIEESLMLGVEIASKLNVEIESLPLTTLATAEYNVDKAIRAK